MRHSRANGTRHTQSDLATKAQPQDTTGKGEFPVRSGSKNDNDNDNDDNNNRRAYPTSVRFEVKPDIQATDDDDDECDV